MRPRVVMRLAATVLVTGAASLVVTAGSSPAQAAACSTSAGVTVVTDFHDLGGGVPSVCVADGAGETASHLFPEAGFPLTGTQRQPGFVCRVSGLPTADDDPCVNTPPASAYWGLWWSDGDPGSGWTYSSLGAGSLTIPAGGLVAFSWDDVSGDQQPRAASTRPAVVTSTPTPTPTHTPTHPATSAPTPHPTATSAPAPGGPTTSATDPTSTTPTATSTTTPTPTTSPTARPRHHRTTAAPDVAAPAPPGDPVPLAAQPAGGGGLPGWVAPVVVIGLFGGAGGTLLWRRRHQGPS